MTDAADISAWPLRTGDVCADFFGTTLRAARPTLRPDARVLEVGCCEYDWLTPAAKAWPSMSFTGIDWRRRKPESLPPGVRYRQANVMTSTLFPLAEFDWIVAVSTMEHIGLGYYGQDPEHEDGDRIGMANLWSWLAPGGWLFFDVPWTPGAYRVHERKKYREYDDAAASDRLLVPCHGARVAWMGTAHLSAPTVLVADPQPRDEGLWMRGWWLQKPEA